MNIIAYILLFTASFSTFADNGDLKSKMLSASPQAGQGIYEFLNYYNLLESTLNVEKFLQLNALTYEDYIMRHKKYILPIYVYTYNGKSIRSTLDFNDYDHALKIQRYNEVLFSQKVVDKDYRDSKILWIPYHLHPDYIAIAEAKNSQLIIEKLFGEKYQSVEKESNLLANKVYYIVAGHGGPDPGAMGSCHHEVLCEDEYAYDVSLRLTRKLLANGAIVYNIIQDPNDGIRDATFLSLDRDEVALGGESIPLDQVERLRQRADIVNEKYTYEKLKGRTEHLAVVIHVDSRHKNHRQDVFFLHHENSKIGKKVATQLLETFAEKYKAHRYNGEYHGHTKSRNLFMLRETHPPTVYIELANIKNPKDQERIILKSNREALAQWIYEGLIR